MDKHFRRDASEVISRLGSSAKRFAGREILLTCAGGFLGSHFVHFFLSLNDSGILEKPCLLRAWDNNMRGVPPWFAPLAERKDLVLEEKDITLPNEYGNPDFIIHAASIASPTYYRKYPIETMDANVIGLRRLLDYSKSREIEGFLFFSTSEIYGDPDSANIPTPETYRGFVSCTGPRACYDESKRFGETLCVNYWHVHSVPVKIVRPFNNFGTGLKISDRRIIPDLFRDVIQDRNLILLSDGRATRTFCYISDAIVGYLLALLSKYSGEPFNIGNQSPEISMLDLANKIIDVSGKPLQVIFKHADDPQYLTDNPQRRCPDISKARTKLGFEPEISLEDGLARTWSFYQDYRLAEEK